MTVSKFMTCYYPTWKSRHFFNATSEKASVNMEGFSFQLTGKTFEQSEKVKYSRKGQQLIANFLCFFNQSRTTVGPHEITTKNSPQRLQIGANRRVMVLVGLSL